METKNDGGSKQIRPYLHPLVFNKVRICEKCTTNERMMFWRNVKMKPDYQFEFLVCPICGYTVMFEKYVRHTATSIDMTRPDLFGHLHDLTKGSRAAATKFLTEDAKNKAISMQNLRYITLIDEEKMIADENLRIKREREEIARKERAANDSRTIIESCNNVRANGINFQLKVTRARQEEERKEREKQAKYVCKYCTKKFTTLAKLNNHRCNPDDKETYIERAKRLQSIGNERKSRSNASSA